MASYLIFSPFTREVFQGCLFSMLLYIIAAEVLASFINANKRIKGIQIGDHEIKMVNFADDTTIYLINITCLNRIQMILKLYEDASTTTFIKIWDLLMFNKFSFHHKWNEVQLLLINMVYTSCLTSCQTT